MENYEFVFYDIIDERSFLVNYKEKYDNRVNEKDEFSLGFTGSNVAMSKQSFELIIFLIILGISTSMSKGS